MELAVAGAILFNGATEAELMVSPNNAVIASSPAVAHDAHVALEREGCPIKVANASVDLGVDTVGARRRAATKATERALKAKRRTGRIMAEIRRRASLAKIATGHWTSGSRLQGTYGHQVMGPSPSAITQQRLQATQAIAGKVPGRCLATALAMLLGHKGPGIELRKQTALEWLFARFANPNHRERIAHAWRLIFAKTTGSGNKRWRKMVGPISAVHAILVDAGWDCPTSCEWSRQPREAGLAEQTRLLHRKNCGGWEQRREEIDPSQLALELCQTIETGYWKDAAKHLDGEGLKRGGAGVYAVTSGMNRVGAAVIAMKSHYGEW
ncbi:unnamed protein product, partial [Prorocentrum cordatum]